MENRLLSDGNIDCWLDKCKVGITSSQYTAARFNVRRWRSK